MKKFQGSFIFWTLLSKNCLFFDNFDKQLVLVKILTCNNKSWANINSKLNLGPLLLLPLMNLTKFSCLSKLSKSRQFLLSKVQKMTEPWNFFIKQKMFEICDFHNKFSNSEPYDFLEWVPDRPEHHGQKIGFRAACEGSIWNFIEPGALFWVYATAARRCFDPANTWCMRHPPTV